MSTFAMLSRAKSLGFNLTAVLVQAFLEERGYAPIGVIADACQVSPRSVERAIAQLKAQGLLPQKKTSFLSHDHADHSNKVNGAPTATAVVPAAAGGPAATTGAPAAPLSPLAERLLAHGILPWCVDQLVAGVDEAVIERQLAYHEHRLATGFAFKAHPARYLFRACLNDYQAPEGYAAPHAVATPQAAAARHGDPSAAPRPVAAVPRREPVRASAQPAEAPTRPADAPPEAAPAPMTRAGALAAIRLGLRSKLPFMRAEALRLAAEWGVDPATMACEAV